MTDIQAKRKSAYDKLMQFFPAGPDGKVVVGGRRIANGFNEGEVMFVGVPVEGLPGLMTLADAIAMTLRADPPEVYWERANINFVDTRTSQPKLIGPEDLNEPSDNPRGPPVWDNEFSNVQAQLTRCFDIGEMPSTFRTYNQFATEVHEKVANIQAKFSGMRMLTAKEQTELEDLMDELCLIAIAGKVSVNTETFEQ